MLAQKIASSLVQKLPQGFVMCYGTGKARPKFVNPKVCFVRMQYDDYKPVVKKKVEDEQWVKELNIFNRQITKENMEMERVLQAKSIVDDQVVNALTKAGNASSEALRIKREMDQFYEANREWLDEEKRQIGQRDEDLTGKDEKV